MGERRQRVVSGAVVAVLLLSSCSSSSTSTGSPEAVEAAEGETAVASIADGAECKGPIAADRVALSGVVFESGLEWAEVSGLAAAKGSLALDGAPLIRFVASDGREYYLLERTGQKIAQKITAGSSAILGFAPGPIAPDGSLGDVVFAALLVDKSGSVSAANRCHDMSRLLAAALGRVPGRSSAAATARAALIVKDAAAIDRLRSAIEPLPSAPNWYASAAEDRVIAAGVTPDEVMDELEIVTFGVNFPEAWSAIPLTLCLHVPDVGWNDVCTALEAGPLPGSLLASGYVKSSERRIRVSLHESVGDLSAPIGNLAEVELPEPNAAGVSGVLKLRSEARAEAELRADASAGVVIADMKVADG